MKKYNILNNTLGWLCFIIAAVTYLLTIEPTASFWDCPEFILQGAKLEVGHPPGNPIFMLAARFFITLFGGSMATAAVAVNSMSALLSAATILLLFWTITHLVKRLIVADDATEVSPWATFIIMASGMCGALAYTWSDTFWFSAVEGEVYAFSSFCTALVFWLMLKWENRADQPHSDRYLVLIAYVIGVSIAVHLLNLLCIPALGLIFYYRKWKKINATGSLIALGVSCVIVGAILYGLVPGFVKVAQWFELFFVNGLGLSYNMGVLIYAILLVAVFVMAIRALYRRTSPTAVRIWFLASIVLSGMPFIGHGLAIGLIISIALAVYLFFFCSKIPVRIFTLITLSIMVIFAGYSSYALLLIRASANTPMNQNAPDNVFSLASYLNREQYGDRPLFRGPVFAETIVTVEAEPGSGNYYVPMDEYGRPQTRPVEGYLRNEQGSPYNSPEKMYTKVAKQSPSDPDEYVMEVERPNYRTLPDLDMFFTRIYSNDPEGRHVAGYKAWGLYENPDFKNIPAEVRKKWAAQRYAPAYEVMSYLPSLETITTHQSSDGQTLATENVWKADFSTNLRYFVNYQLNHMYWRYFMWNFAGRQNDIQGNGEPQFGNWISGIPAIDNARLGDQSSLPDDYGKNNKGHNVFYMLPLLLGLIGMLWQALAKHRIHPDRGIQQFWVVFFLFFMTGIAIVLYLNQTPGQPRERDYAFAGSFYAYAIWIGIGIAAIAMMLKQLFSPKHLKEGQHTRPAALCAAAVAGILALFVPLQMVSQTWDDHDRSGRYAARDFGFNYLSSVDENGIIFTNGDNDTFPLWYAQEVEGFRNDVRVVNLSYLTTDWYANQMKMPTLGGAPIDFLAKPTDYAYERLAYSYIVPNAKKDSVVSVLDGLNALYSQLDPRYNVHLLTTPKMNIPVDRQAMLARYAADINGADSAAVKALENINVDFSGASGLNQSRVLSLDIIASSMANGYKRPVYFASTVPSSYYLGLYPNMATTGLAWEVTPFKTGQFNPNVEKAYRNVVTNFRWGGLDQPNADKLYLDETIRRMVSSLRLGIQTISENLIASGSQPASKASREAAAKAGLKEPANHYDMARQLLDMMQTKLPSSVSGFDGLQGIDLARAYLTLYLAQGNKADLENADKLAQAEINRYAQLVKYASTLSPQNFALIGRQDSYALQYLGIAEMVKYYADVLRATPADKLEETANVISKMSAETELRLAPALLIDGLSYEEILKELSNAPGEAQSLLQQGADVIRIGAQVGVPVTAYSDSVAAKHGFTRQQWYSVTE